VYRVWSLALVRSVSCDVKQSWEILLVMLKIILAFDELVDWEMERSYLRTLFS